MLPPLGDNPVTGYVAAFALIFIAVALVGALLGWVLSRAWIWLCSSIESTMACAGRIHRAPRYRAA